MTKTTKKAKISKAKDKASKARDSITGNYMQLEGTRFSSDTTYDLLNSAQASALKRYFGNSYNTDDGRFTGGSYQGEFEFGSSAIINTNRAIYAQEGVESLQRIVLLGSFTYNNNGAFVEGRVTEVASWTNAKSLATGETDYEYGTIDIRQVQLRDNMWNSDLRLPPDTPPAFQYDSRAEVSGIESDSRDEFSRYQSSKYFEPNWWNNPFSTNLI